MTKHILRNETRLSLETIIFIIRKLDRLFTINFENHGEKSKERHINNTYVKLNKVIKRRILIEQPLTLNIDRYISIVEN